MKRQWSINGRFLTQRVSGVQRYAREIVLALDHFLAVGHPLAADIEITLVVPKGTSHDLQLRHIPTRNVAGVSGHFWEQLVLPGKIAGGLLSLCNSGPIALSKHIVCIHDINTRLHPAGYMPQFRALYRVLLPSLGRSAHTIVTVSRFSAEQLAAYRVATRCKIMIAPDGHEHALRWKPTHSQATRLAAGKGTVVLIGSLAPHKNIGLVLDLAPRLGTAGLKVAVAGVRDTRVFRKPLFQEQAANVCWLGRVSDNELAALLKDSLCLAFPSFAEGFGLPALEAMALGCPVVASNQASLPEICADAALLASPYDKMAWLQHFLSLRRHEELRMNLVAKGQSRAQQFSWMRSAEIYLRLMAEADGVRDDGRSEHH